MFRSIINKFKRIADSPSGVDPSLPLYEYCPRCDANLTLQRGYSNDLPYWVCKGCGEMLINPEVEEDSDISWICDRCGSMLNIQDGFPENNGEWVCTECGFMNKIDKSEVYGSEDEFQAAFRNPYKGLSDADVLSLSMYRELGCVAGRDHIILVEHCETGARYIKKLLSTYNKSIYQYLQTAPVACMPKILELYESDNCLIVMEEFVEGQTVAELLEEKVLPEEKAIWITRCVCHVLDELHSRPVPIIHRDIKPSNIIVTPDWKILLLDMNVAKWYDPDQADDTIYMGTQFYAAPEQLGYGLSASSPKADIYAVGMLLNVMLTGHFPKEEKAPGALWEVVERCICLDAENRYTAKELLNTFDKIQKDNK